MIFLRSAVATLIPSVAIPVSLIGTLAVMQLLGFSLNVLTLLAFVLAIGLLVDDAIVVLENSYRRQELGDGREEAARRGSREVFFAVIATTVALLAVLMPLSIMTGGTGRLFREFSITMATAVALSTFVAVTLVPMMCSRFLNVTTQHGSTYNGIERVLRGLSHSYGRALSFSTRHVRVVLIFLAANALGAAVIFMAIPKSLTPTEDRGKILTVARTPQGATLAYTRETILEVERTLLQTPEVSHTFAAVGLSSGGSRSTSRGWVYARLHPWEERDVTQQELVRSLFMQFLQIPSALIFPVNLPSMGQSFYDLEFVLKSSGADLDEFDRVSQAILDRAAEIPGLINVDRDLELENPLLSVEFDRDRAADLGVPIASIAEALQTTLAESAVSEFVLRNRQYDVITSLAPRFRAVPDQIGKIHVRARNGAMVPLSNLVRIVAGTAPDSLNHYDLQRSVKITGTLSADASLGSVLDQVEAIAREEMPDGFGTALAGSSREFRESSTEIYFTFGIALLFIYLVLAAQFESFLHPLTILLSVPLALLGALLALYVAGHTINIFSQVGMILLVGLVAKNSILLVDYANNAHAAGRSLLDSVLEAGRTRFRPILMTSVTSILGAVPLMIATGAGAETRRPIGAAVVGGLLFSTLFTLLVIPVVHLVLVGTAERLRSRKRGESGERAPGLQN
jgi:multidrug efflux pump